MLSTTFGALGGALTFLFIGLFVALDPDTYSAGVLHLLPPARRPRAREILAEVGHALRQWMLGKIASALLVGIATWFGLFLLDIPLALSLAILAGVLTFIPNFGPVLSAVPALLLALLAGPATMLYVGALYLGIQTVESYVVTPLMEKKMIALPPALTLMAQVLMATLAGGLGVVAATPLTAAVVVLLKEAYVRDVLHDAPEA